MFLLMIFWVRGYAVQVHTLPTQFASMKECEIVAVQVKSKATAKEVEGDLKVLCVQAGSGDSK